MPDCVDGSPVTQDGFFQHPVDVRVLALLSAVLVEIQNDPPGDLNPPFHRRSFVRDDPGLDVVFILLGIEAEREE
jgi:hypothetical protein